MRTRAAEIVGLRDHVGSIGIAMLLAVIGTAALACGDSQGGANEGVSGTSPGVEASRSPTTRTETPSSTSTGGVAMADTQVSESVESEDPSGREVLENVSFEDGDRAYHEKRYEDAVEIFSVYTEEHPGNPWGHYMLGLASWKAGQLTGAEEALKQALLEDSTHVKSLINLSRVLLEQDRPGDALAHVEKAVELEEKGGGLRVLARTRYELGQEDEAIDAYRRALVADDEDAWSMNNLGLIFIRRGDFEGALGPLARGTELRDDVAIFQNNLGIALERTGHLREAEEAYAKAIELEPGYEKASVNLARVEVRERHPETEPVDLTQLAQRFAREVEGWRQELASEAEPVEPDSVDVAEEAETSVGTDEERSTPEQTESPPPGQGR